MDEATLLAEGWKRIEAVRYTAAIGPTWTREIDGKSVVGLQAQEHLGNDNLGIVHGGALMTFADIALGYGVSRAHAHRTIFVTAQLQFHFVGVANAGDFITCEPEVIRKTSQLVFIRGLFEVGGRPIATADGIFKLVDPAKVMRAKAG